MSASTPTMPTTPPRGLRERLAQLMIVRIGSNLPPIRTVDDDTQRVAELIETCPIGGLILFNGGSQTRAALDKLRRSTAIPLLVTSDVERGVGQQVRGHTLFPHAMAFSRLGDDAASAVGRFAEITAVEARAAGIHVAMAPVADVSTNPRNPIISIRAFSEEPCQAAELAAAYVRSAESAGMLTTAKHFPGHGDTQQDSHDSLPVVNKSLAELLECELVPFRAAIDAGCSAVMTAHIAFPKLDPSGLPATLSPVLLQQVLRDELGFSGAVLSDSLLMAGVRDRFATEGEMLHAALAAGVDLLLDVADPAAAVDYLESCVVRGSLGEARVDEAFQRVWTLKQRAFGAWERQLDNVDENTTMSHAAAVARAAIHVIRGREGEAPAEPSASANFRLGGSLALPLDPSKPLTAILLKPFSSPLDPSEQPLAAALREKFADVRYVEIGPTAMPDAFATAAQLAGGAEQLVVAMIVRPAAWHAFGLPIAQQDFVRQISAQRAVVVVSLGMPQALTDFPNATAAICTYSDVVVSQQALADYLVANR